MNGAAASSASGPTTPLAYSCDNGRENPERAGNIFARKKAGREPGFVFVAAASACLPFGFRVNSGLDVGLDL